MKIKEEKIKRRWRKTIQQKTYKIKSDSVPKTFDILCLEILKKLNDKAGGGVTAREWTKALGYKHQNSLVRVVNRILKNYPEKIKIYNDKRPRLYEAR